MSGFQSVRITATYEKHLADYAGSELLVTGTMPSVVSAEYGPEVSAGSVGNMGAVTFWVAAALEKFTSANVEAGFTAPNRIDIEIK